MSFRKLASVIGLTAAMALSACSSGGNTSLKNETSATVDQKIQDGVTTKDQVRQLFGDPVASTFTDSGHEEWKYVFRKAQADATNFIPVYGSLHSGSHGKEKHLTVIFNGNVVWHHSMSESAVSGSAGAF